VMAVNDAHERRRRGAAAYAAVRTRYGWPILGAQLASIYEALLGWSPVT
jgi:glycosyltransferase involved in cell wall biosynthesis